MPTDHDLLSIYLANLQSMQYGCKFATICDRKGYLHTCYACAERFPSITANFNFNIIVHVLYCTLGLHCVLYTIQ